MRRRTNERAVYFREIRRGELLSYVKVWRWIQVETCGSRKLKIKITIEDCGFLNVPTDTLHPSP